MRNIDGNADLDAAWLKSRMPYASENQIEYFLERVAILMEGGGIPVDIARANALKLIKYSGIK